MKNAGTSFSKQMVTDTHPDKCKHRVFLASTWHQKDVTEFRKVTWEKYRAALSNNHDQVWVAEHSAVHLDPNDGALQLEIIDACLEAIENSARMVFIDTGQVGTRLAVGEAVAESSFLELELFQAILLSRPIHYIFIGRGQEASQYHRMLAALANDGISMKCFDQLQDAGSYIDDLLTKKNSVEMKIPGSAVTSFTAELIKTRHQDWSNTNLFAEPQLLRGQAVGTDSPRPNLDLARQYLDLADAEVQTNRLLTRTWIGMRILMSAHYTATSDTLASELWSRALGLWSRAAAWRGLHGHIWLGNLAALGSTAAIRRRSGDLYFDSETPDQTDLYGAMASAYYSISKKAPRRLEAPLLARSQAYVDAGLASRPDEFHGGLLPLLGSLHYRKRRYRLAAKTFSTALDLAEKQGAPDSELGFLMTELGFTEIYLLRPAAGRRRIEQGLTLMEAGGSNAGFLTRATRKHMLASLACFDLTTARKSAEKALRLAEENKIFDQIDRITARLGRKKQH